MLVALFNWCGACDIDSYSVLATLCHSPSRSASEANSKVDNARSILSFTDDESFRLAGSENAQRSDKGRWVCPGVRRAKPNRYSFSSNLLWLISWKVGVLQGREKVARRCLAVGVSLYRKAREMTPSSWRSLTLSLFAVIKVVVLLLTVTYFSTFK